MVQINNEILLTYKKQNNTMSLEITITSEVTQTEKGMHVISLMCGIEYTNKDKNGLITEQKHTYRQREKTYGYESGNGGGKSGAWDECTHPTLCKPENQQGPAVCHGELYSILCDYVIMIMNIV